LDYQFMAAGGEYVADGVASRATLLTLVEVDLGDVAMTQVAKKGDDPFVIRYACAFLDRRREEKITLRHDNEPGMTQLVTSIIRFRAPRVTVAEPINRAEHQALGWVLVKGHIKQCRVRRERFFPTSRRELVKT
jgi:hypothetical protein